IFDQGSAGDLYYIAMEYVAGRSLRELLTARGRLNPREALDILEGVLAGLAVAHDAGIVHRDVKPENVLLGNGTAVKVADFGLARAAAGIRHTRTGLLIGTAAYLAPEQVSDNTSDQRTDVYAAGVMLFEMLTGRQPHTGDTPLEVAYKHVNSVVPAPSRENPELSPSLDALVAIATSRDPDLRPADAGQYLHAIKEVRRGMPLPPVTRPDGRAPAGAQAWPSAAGANGTVQTGGGGRDGGDGFGGGRHGGAGAAGGAGAGAGAPGTTAVGPPAYDRRTAQYSRPGYLPAATGPREGSGHHTMVIPVGQEPEFGGGYPGHRHQARGYHEPFLQQWLFSRRILVVPVVALLAVLIWWLGFGRYSTVPSEIGKPVAAARSDLVSAGFHVTTANARHSDTVKQGNVMSISPAAGTRTGNGAQVVITPSSGPVLKQMPAVTGSSIQDAENQIKQAGFTQLPRVVGQPSIGVPPDTVMATNPGAFQQWPENKPVKLYVPGVPDFAGQQIGDVQAAASAGGYNINQISDTTSTQPQGTVTGQDVKPGTLIQPGMVVNVQVSQNGSSPGQINGEVNIPDEFGKTQADATNDLEGAGFNVQVIQGLLGGDVVVGESPTGQAPPGTTITITLGF
ncbi:MAG: PASTA domain-containing protein, partial [Actinobacteria bacterium]|nr:PASTA domain-containing protein [Actinomycetota bacterium]